jgi:tetratricopeptide (TPR) repeat protein
VILSPYYNHYGISYYYPSYHRKYLFVSLGGYWPYSYRYQRYYWYGCHPYYWYGSDVVSLPDTITYDYTNYTTYNYYNTTPAVTTAVQAAVTTDLAEDSAATDTPMPQTQADINFAGAVNAFEEGRYDNAAELFREAILQSPEDEIMPFTYTQALFASGDYALAAYVLREVMTKMPSDEPAVYFPRGLYKDDQILLNQIAQLESAIVMEPFSTDYQLLLGYQYLGIAQWDKAANALEQAARNPLNAGVVTKLLDIAEKMENDAQETMTAPQG